MIRWYVARQVAVYRCRCKPRRGPAVMNPGQHRQPDESEAERDTSR